MSRFLAIHKRQSLIESYSWHHKIWMQEARFWRGRPNGAKHADALYNARIWRVRLLAVLATLEPLESIAF